MLKETTAHKEFRMFEADRSLACSRWQLVRLLPGHECEVVLLSLSFFELTTHWHETTVVCPGEDCDLCQVLPARGLFYAAVTCSSRLSILELGAQSASHLEQHLKLLHGGMLAGQVIALKRRTAKSPVISQCVRFQEKCQAVPPLELVRRVMAIYKFAPPNPDESIESYELRCRRAAILRNRRLADSLLTRSPSSRV